MIVMAAGTVHGSVHEQVEIPESFCSVEFIEQPVCTIQSWDHMKNCLHVKIGQTRPQSGDSSSQQCASRECVGEGVACV